MKNCNCYNNEDIVNISNSIKGLSSSWYFCEHKSNVLKEAAQILDDFNSLINKSNEKYRVSEELAKELRKLNPPDSSSFELIQKCSNKLDELRGRCISLENANDILTQEVSYLQEKRNALILKTREHVRNDYRMK